MLLLQQKRSTQQQMKRVRELPLHLPMTGAVMIDTMSKMFVFFSIRSPASDAPRRSEIAAAFFSEEDVAAAAAAAASTLEHLQPEQAEAGEEWVGLSDEEGPSSPPAPAVAAADEARELSRVAATTTASTAGGDDDECLRIVRLINAATAGDVRAMDELIEALEVRRVTCDVRRVTSDDLHVACCCNIVNDNEECNLYPA